MRRLKISGSSSMAMEMREGAITVELLFEEETTAGEAEAEEEEEEGSTGEEGWLW